MFYGKGEAGRKWERQDDRTDKYKDSGKEYMKRVIRR
jgi:hypothetical protein